MTFVVHTTHLFSEKFEDKILLSRSLDQKLKEDLLVLIKNNVLTPVYLKKIWEKIDELEVELLKSRKVSDADRALLEACRLLVMETLANRFLECEPSRKPAPPPPRSHKERLKMVALGFLAFLGLIQDGILNFLFFESVFVLIEALAYPIVLLLSALFTLACTVFFFAVEISSMKKILGIQGETLLEEKKFDELTQDEVAHMKAMNEMVFNPILLNQVREKDPALLAEDSRYLLKQFNNLLKKRKENPPRLERAIVRRILGVAVIVVGLAMTGAGSYFGATSLLTLLGGTLVGTPAGWAIISILVVAGLLFFLSLYGRQTFHMMNPEIRAEASMQKSLSSYDEGKTDAAYDSAVRADNRDIISTVRTDNRDIIRPDFGVRALNEPAVLRRSASCPTFFNDVEAVDSSVSKEWPAAPHGFGFRPIDLGMQDTDVVIGLRK